MTQTLELSEKDFKAAIIQTLQETIINILAINVEIKSFSKEIEGRKKNQTEILAWENIISTLSPISLNGFSIRINMTAKRGNELERLINTNNPI